jgi:hypothetical protein
MMTKNRPSHNAILRKIAVLPLFLILTISLTFSQETNQQNNMIDFSGKWVLNKSKSISPLSDVASSTLIIAQSGYSLTMDITITPNDGKPINRTEKYLLNVSVQSAPHSQTPDKKSIRIDCIPGPDGKSFSITETLSSVKNGTKMESKRVSVYSMGKGGKTLIIKQDDTSTEASLASESAKHETRVYDKSL